MITNKSETIALRATVIAGMRYADDYQVTWRGLTIGRIIKSSGVPAHIAQWSWTCYVHGKPGAGASGTGIDLDDCKQHFKRPHGHGYAAASRTMTSRERIDTLKAAQKRSPDTTGSTEHEIHGRPPVRRSGSRDGEAAGNCKWS